MFMPAVINEDGSYTRRMYPEEWRYIPGYEGLYAISNYGEIYSFPRFVAGKNGTLRFIQGKMKKLHINNHGYLSVNLFKENKVGNNMNVHVWVALAFLGPRPHGYQVCHFDGDRLNPCVWNLRYDTITNNQADRYLHGTHQLGSQNPGVIYLEENIRGVKRLLSLGLYTLRQVSEMTGIHYSTICSINQGINWAHITI